MSIYLYERNKFKEVNMEIKTTEDFNGVIIETISDEERKIFSIKASN